MTPIEIEQAIVARLKERLATGDDRMLKVVYDTREYTAVEEESQLVPAAAVLYNGYRTDSEVGNGTVQAVVFEYLVVVVTRSSEQTLRATGAKVQASEIFDAVVRTLIGWKPATAVKRLALGDAPGAGYSDAGFTYLPIAFTTRMTYTPNP